MGVNYCKRALTFGQQADLLLDRGLIADRALLIARLREVNYYRLSGYLYTGLEKHLQAELATTYGIPGPVLRSWLLTLNYVRNACAHHARIWDRDLAIQPYIPYRRIQPEWYVPVDVSSRRSRMFCVLTVLRYLLGQIAPQSRWQDRLEQLLTAKHPGIPITQMGFPTNWEDCPIWRR